MKKPHSRAAQLAAEFQDSVLNDYDPEDGPNQDSDDESQDNGNDLNGTEHYTNVGKSQLRKPQEVALGPQYAGSRISRKELLENESDGDIPMGDSDGDSDAAEGFADPDELDFEVDDEDGEIDSDDALGESDLERFKKFTFRGSSKPNSSKRARKKRPTAADFMSDSEDGEKNSEQSDEEAGSSDDDQSEAEDEDEDKVLSDDEGSESESGSDEAEDEEESRAELKKMMSEEQKTVVATVKKAAKEDADKGTAIKQQRKTFDSLLNVRIRLQKALVSTNSMSALETSEDDHNAPYQAAEEAAIKLWNTLDTMRHQLAKSDDSTKTGEKRKREVDVDTPSAAIWEQMETLESHSMDIRRATLERWSKKLDQSRAAPIQGKLRNTTNQHTILNALDEQLSNTERLVKRTRLPRSCAPVQVRQKITEDQNIFDDADFYQLLLKELVDQRMDSSEATGGVQAAQVAQLAALQAKVKKEHTKASKGRKMRFTVHEKLQNFMAPEDRSQWEPEAIDGFFSSLLGQKNVLVEEDVEESDEDEEDKLEGEDKMILFRS